MAIPPNVPTECCAPWTNYDYVAVFTAAAGTTGANEASGGNYARQKTSYTPNNAGKNTGTEQTISVPSGKYPEAGVFDAATAGTFGGSVDFAGGEVNVSGANASIDVTISLEIQ